jgi:hypothetical protein
VLHRNHISPPLSGADTGRICRRKAYADSSVGALCRNFAAHSCYKETI